jgi:hypothetical protein
MNAPVAVGVDQQAQHHPRVIASSTDPASTSAPFELADINSINGVDDEPDEMITWQPAPHVRRQKKGLITQHRTIRLGHAT